MPDKPVEIERVRYRQGQLLRAGDFSVQEATAARLRAWHNRALHNAFGVARGFAVEPRVDEDGELTGLTVPCGVAYDCFGNKLVLQKARRLALPRAPSSGEGAWILLTRLREVERSCEPASQTLCPPGPRAPVENDLEFIWRRAGWIDPRQGLPLARIRLADGVFHLHPGFEPRAAQPLARPHLAAGSTIPGNTPWEPWTVGGLIIGLQTAVDASSAGFTRTPHYTATLVHGSWARAPLFALTHIADPSPRGFTFRVLLAGLPQRSFEPATASAAVSAVEGTALVVESAASFRIGDAVDLFAEEGAEDGAKPLLTAKIQQIDHESGVLSLDSDIPGSNVKSVRLADLRPGQPQLRLAGPTQVRTGDKLLLHSRLDVEGARPASLVEIESVTIQTDDPRHPDTVHSVVTIRPPAPTHTPEPMFTYTPGEFVVATTLNPRTVQFPVLARSLGWYVCWTACLPFKKLAEVCPGHADRPDPCSEKPRCEAQT